MKTIPNTILKFGVLAAIIICAVLFTGIALTDMSNPDPVAGFIVLTSGMIVAFLLLFPAIRQINAVDKRSFGANVLLCLAIVLVAAIIYSIAWTIYIFYINPDIVKSMETYLLGQLDAETMSAAEFAKGKEGVESQMGVYANPISTFAWTLLEPSPSGLIMTLIVSTTQFFKNKK